MNVYDFDKTIYDGDSTIDFYMWLWKRHPKMTFNIGHLLVGALAYVLHIKDKTWMKERYFHAFTYVPDIEREIKLFWKEHIHKIYPYYLLQQKPDDVIISASPLFDVEEACRLLNIRYVLASPVDPKSGHYHGENCHGEEKVRRFKETFPTADIEQFYSDSYSDSPLAHIAKEAYIIKKGRILPWPKEKR